MKKIISVSIVLLFIFSQSLAEISASSFPNFSYIIDVAANQYTEFDHDSYLLTALYHTASFDYINKFGFIFPVNKSPKVDDDLISDLQTLIRKDDNLTLQIYFNNFKSSELYIYCREMQTSEDTLNEYNKISNYMNDKSKNSTNEFIVKSFNALETYFLSRNNNLVRTAYQNNNNTNFKAYLEDNKIIFAFLIKPENENKTIQIALKSSNENIYLDALHFFLLTQQSSFSVKEENIENLPYINFYNNNISLLNIKADAQSFKNEKEAVQDFNKKRFFYSQSLQFFVHYMPTLKFEHYEDFDNVFYICNYWSIFPEAQILLRKYNTIYDFTLKPNKVNDLDFYKYVSLFTQNLSLK